MNKKGVEMTLGTVIVAVLLLFLLLILILVSSGRLGIFSTETGKVIQTGSCSGSDHTVTGVDGDEGNINTDCKESWTITSESSCTGNAKRKVIGSFSNLPAGSTDVCCATLDNSADNSCTEY